MPHHRISMQHGHIAMPHAAINAIDAWRSARAWHSARAWRKSVSAARREGAGQ